ncbi:MAG: hemerythrin domain-containing protein, partial [Micromonosporaceae bacterium]
IDLLVQDHREVERLFVELESGVGSAQHRRDLADTVIAELVRHSVAEEMYLYPTARQALKNGEDIVEHELAEHAEAERTMKALEAVDSEDPRFNELWHKLAEEIRHHVAEEEKDLFPRLQGACDKMQLKDLGRKLEAAKAVAPTRPHPASPDRPPWNMALDPGAGLVDRVRDTLSGRKTSPQDLE